MGLVASYEESGSIGIVLSSSVLGSVGTRNDLNVFPNSYSHKIVANGGFWEAQFTTASILAPQISDIGSLIGLDVRCISGVNRLAWNGFVNSVSVDVGLGSFTIGPLIQVKNSLSVLYQTTRYNTNPPIGGQQRRLSAVTDSGSVLRYGILGHELSGGTGDAAGAVALQLTHLDENKNPGVNQSLVIGASSGGSATVTVQCLGYVHLLDKFIYTVTSSGYQTSVEKIQAVLDAEPNGLFGNMLFTGGDSNMLSVPISGSEETGWATIKSVVSLGDEGANRYIFGIGEDRVAYYSIVGDTYEYYMRPDGSVFDDSGFVNPYDLKAGVWIDASSLVPGSSVVGEIGSAISDVFIESLTCTSPMSAQIEGGKVSRSIQQLAQRGVGGSF